MTAQGLFPRNLNLAPEAIQPRKEDKATAEDRLNGEADRLGLLGQQLQEEMVQTLGTVVVV